jgi:hypothetical protein
MCVLPGLNAWCRAANSETILMPRCNPPSLTEPAVHSRDVAVPQMHPAPCIEEQRCVGIASSSVEISREEEARVVGERELF